MAYASRAQLLMLAQRDEEAIAAGERAMALARELDDDAALVHAQTTVGSALAYAREVEAGRAALLRTRSASASPIGADEQVCRAAVNVAWTALDLQRLDRAEAGRATALALADAREQRTFRLYALATRARLHVARGRWDAAVADAEEVLAQSEVPQSPACRRSAASDSSRAAAAEARAGAARGGRGPGVGDRRAAAPRPVACALAELAWLRDDRAAIDDVTRERTPSPARSATRGTSASSRAGAGGPACWTGPRLRRAPPAPDLGRAARRRGVLARDRRPLQAALCLADSDDPDALAEALRSPTSSAPRPSRRGCAGAARARH